MPRLHIIFHDALNIFFDSGQVKITEVAQNCADAQDLYGWLGTLLFLLNRQSLVELCKSHHAVTDEHYTKQAFAFLLNHAYR